MKLVRASVVAVVLVSAAVAAVPASAWADRDGDTDAYTLVVSPATVSGGSSTTFTLALTQQIIPALAARIGQPGPAVWIHAERGVAAGGRRRHGHDQPRRRGASQPRGRTAGDSAVTVTASVARELWHVDRRLDVGGHRAA